ncbi:hypothetical protein E1171_06880 [Cytophagales bacterium RKSG123]|nr:hypothetical protein [Xanthovirga aplysinae]
MKTFKLIPLLFFFFYHPIMGQTSQGNFLLGGVASFNVQNDVGQEGRVSTLSVSPNFGYFIIDNLAMGLSLPLNFKWDKWAGGKGRNINLVLGPFAKYYIPVADRVSFFGETALGLGTTNVKQDPRYRPIEPEDPLLDPQIRYKEILRVYKLGMGLVYFLSPQVGLEGELAYVAQSTRLKSELIDFLNDTEKNRNLSFTIGLQVYL